MKLVENEKKLSSHGSLVLTNKRLIQNKKSWGRIILKEIPLNKIDSICFEHSIDILAIIIGIILIIISLIMGEALFGYFKYILFLLGISIFILGFLSEKEFVDFNSNTLKIREEKKNIENFIDVVRNEIYK